MKATEWIAAYKAKRGISTTYGLAKALKVSRQAVMKYERGETVPGPVVAFRIAEALGEQPAALVAEFEQERAERDGDTVDAADMSEFLRKIAGGAMSVLLAAGMGGFLSPGANLAHSATDATVYTSSQAGKKRRRVKSGGPSRPQAGHWDGLMRRARDIHQLACMAVRFTPALAY